MATTRTRLTAEEFWRMGSGDTRQELVDGEVIEMAPAGWLHGLVVARVAGRLVDHVDTQRTGHVVAGDAGFILTLPGDPDRVRAPDIAFVSAGRLPAGRPPLTFLRGAPDLAVEVLSPSENPEQVQRKVRDYLDAGGRLVWVIAPEARTATVYRADGSARLVRDEETLDGEDVLPGLALRLADLLP